MARFFIVGIASYINYSKVFIFKEQIIMIL